MALSDVALCARALVMIGAAPISSFEEDVAEAEIARMLYPAVRDGMLAGYPWRFAGRGCWLSRLADGDGAGSAKDNSNLFALPRDFIRLLSLENDGVRSRLSSCEIRRSRSRVTVRILAMSHACRRAAFRRGLIWR